MFSTLKQTIMHKKIFTKPEGKNYDNTHPNLVWIPHEDCVDEMIQKLPNTCKKYGNIFNIVF